MTVDSLIQWFWSQSWQLCALAILLLPLAGIVAKKRPHLAFLICFLLLIKAVLPLSLGHQKSAFHWMESTLAAHASERETAELAHAGAAKPAAHIATAPENDFAVATETRLSQLPSAPPDDSKEVPDEIATAAPVLDSKLAGRSLNTRLSLALLSVWITGMLTSSLIILKRHRRLANAIRLASPIENSRINELVEKNKEHLGIKKRVTVLALPDFTSPAMIGWRKPRILLPVGYLEAASAEDLEAVIAHELVHIKRGDVFFSTLQCLVQIIWWFHPVIWLVNKRINHLKELCCDGEVLHWTQIKNTNYAQALLNVLKQNPSIPLPSYVPTASSNEITTYRIETLMKNPSHLTHKTPLIGWGLVIACALFLLPNANLNSASSREETRVPNSKLPKPDAATHLTATAEPKQPLKTDLLDVELKPSNSVQVPVSKILTVTRKNHLSYAGSGSGSLVPRFQYQIQTASDGIIRRMNLVPGTEVKKGELLLELSNESLVASLREAELDLRQAQAELRRHETSVEQKQLELMSNLETAKLNLELCEAEHRRSHALFDQALTTDKSVAQSQTKLAQAKQAVDTAMRSLAITERQNEQDLDLQKIQLERHTLALSAIKKQVEGLRVYAPIAGTITESSSSEPLQLGAYVKSGTQLAQIFQPDRLTLVTTYPARSIHKLKEGMPCIIEIDEHRHGARIRTIYPTTNSDQRVKVLVDPEAEESLAKTILPGSSAKVYFGTKVVPNTLTLPNVLRSAAIGDLSFYKLSPDGSVAKETKIELVSRGLETSAIRGDLQDGDRLIYKGRRSSDHSNRFRTIELVDEPR